MIIVWSEFQKTVITILTSGSTGWNASSNLIGIMRNKDSPCSPAEFAEPNRQEQ
jgi:hypothetical protein